VRAALVDLSESLCASASATELSLETRFLWSSAALRKQQTHTHTHTQINYQEEYSIWHYNSRLVITPAANKNKCHGTAANQSELTVCLFFKAWKALQYKKKQKQKKQVTCKGPQLQPV